MKKIILFFVLIGGFVSAQVKIGSYHLNGRDYNLELTQKNFILIDLPSVDVLSKNIMFKLSFSKAEGFKNRLIEAKREYENFKNISISNKVKNVERKLKTKLGAPDMYFEYGHLQSANNVDLKATLKVVDNLPGLVIENKYIISASDNQFIRTDGFSLVFLKIEDLENFINSIDLAKAESLLAERIMSEKLYK